MQWLDGKALATQLRAGLKQQLATLPHKPQLVTLRVDGDAASAIYVNNKLKAAAAIGLPARAITLPGNCTPAELAQAIDALNADPAVSGILLQLPLPAHLDAASFIRRIDPRKDVDGLTPENAGLLLHGTPRYIPCTPWGCLELIHTVTPDIRGARAVVIGRSVLVGRPLAALLTNHNATVTLAHSQTRNLPALCREADILIAAIGKPGVITAEYIRPGATVIDVGINRTADGIRGDVEATSAAQVAGALTPVPGGVGPMTITGLLANTLKAAAT